MRQQKEAVCVVRCSHFQSQGPLNILWETAVCFNRSNGDKKKVQGISSTAHHNTVFLGLNFSGENLIHSPPVSITLAAVTALAFIVFSPLQHGSGTAASQVLELKAAPAPPYFN